MDLVGTSGSGLVQEVGAPAYGRQHLGYSPGGPQDRFAMRTGNIMLGNADFAPALEIVHAPIIVFNLDCLFVLTGAKRRQASLRTRQPEGETAIEVPHGAVMDARKGDRLMLGEAEYGFRTYLCATSCEGKPEAFRKTMLGRTRPPHGELSTWADPEQRIRLLDGPEYRRLRNPSALLDQPWLTTSAMSDMGIRLAPCGGHRLSMQPVEMISQPVNDGTMQLAPDGPIVLLRKRQTIGGYPRIFNVISADVDLLAQYAPDQVIRFRRVSLTAAHAAAVRQQEDLERLRRRWAKE
jgi:5-oxoprolinase (ATP-hydrolysing) subunit C